MADLTTRALYQNVLDTGSVEDGLNQQELLRRVSAAVQSIDSTGHITLTYPLNSGTSGELVNVKAAPFLAVGDGVNDDTAEIMAAYNTLTAGGVLYFPPGTYLLSGSGITLTKSYVTFRGAGMYTSILKYGGAANLVQSSSLLRAVVMEDLAFDGASLVSNLITLNHSNSESFIIRRCRFINFDVATTARAVSLSGMNGVRIEHCLFHGNATGYGTAVFAQRGIRDFVFSHNKVLWVDTGISVDTGATSSADADVSEFLTIDHNLFDLGWWLIRERFANSGGTVTYSGTVLTDTAAAFSGMAVNDNVRVMAVKQTGTVTFSNTNFVDASATFITNAVRRGDIVRAGGLFAVVKAVESETVLKVEEWLDNVTRWPALYPVSGAYTVYGIVIGQVSSTTATTITVGRWYDFDGNAVTPSAGTRYEALYSRPDYAIHMEYGVRHVQVLNNIVRRGWSDQISIYGDQVQILGNIIEDGEDMGITLNGDHNLVSNNRILHQGAGGIWNTGNDSIISNNYFTNTPWVNAADDYLSHIITTGGASRNIIANNVAEKGTVTYGRYGFATYDGTTPSATGTNENLFIGNKVSGHTVADYYVKKSETANTRLYDNAGTVLTALSATLADQRGAYGTPTITSGFGTTPSIAGSDSAFKVTVGTGGVALTGLVTFKNPWATAPIVLANNETTTLLLKATATTTGVTLASATAWTAGDVLSVIVVGRP